MPTYYARATGNVNGTIWATTPTGTASNLFSSFTSDDTLMANGFTVTLNVNTTVLEIKNDTTGGATAGGSFALNNGVTLTANVAGGSANFSLLQIALSATANVVGAITGNSTSFAAVNLQNAFGTLTVTGSVTGGSGSSDTISVGAVGSVVIVGTVSGGNVGAGFAAVANTVNATVSITGTVTGGNNSATGYGVRNSSTGTISISGTAVGGNQGPAVFGANGSGAITVTRARGNGFGSGSTGLSAAVGVAASQTASIRVSEFEYGDLGQSPTSGPIILTDSTANAALFYRLSGGKKTLTDPAATADFPANSNVRSGTVFANGNRTGTCAVPAAGSVALGVPVDNTTGTAVLTPAAVWSFATSSATTSGSMGERLANAATVASTGQQLANALTP